MGVNMFETHCQSCGRLLNEHEQLQYLWSCTACEAELQRELVAFERELQLRHVETPAERDQ